jgi:hypothetical protein
MASMESIASEIAAMKVQQQKLNEIIAKQEQELNQLKTGAASTSSPNPSPPSPPKLPKYPTPQQWDGKGDMLMKYMIPVLRFLNHFKIHDKIEGIEYAIPLLPNNLQAMWSKYVAECAANGKALPTKFEDFYTIVRSWYPQPDMIRQAMEKMETCRHKKFRIEEYNELWSWIILTLSNHVTTYTVNFKYFKGLQWDIQKDLEGKIDINADTHSQLMSMAAETEARHKLMGNRKPWPTYNPQQASSHNNSNNNGPTPMELGAAKVTKDEPKKRFNGTCHRCGKYGHMKADCRSPLSKNGKPPSQH